jgi:plastocyanin
MIAAALAALVLRAGGGHPTPVDAPPSATPGTRTIVMPGRIFEPKESLALVGETVTWRNDDRRRRHNIVGDGGEFDSGLLEPGASFSHVFESQGSYRFSCTIHRFMTGRVDVYGLAFFGPERTVPAGGHTVFRGVAPAGTAEVRVQRLAADGSFRAVVHPRAPGVYRATAGELVSAPVALRVGAMLSLDASRLGRRFVVRVRARPAQPGAAVVLERYVRERFDWAPFARTRLDDRSRASFALAPRRELRVRAVIERGVRGYGPAESATLVVRPR